MPYALFSDATKASQTFRTKSEVWDFAHKSGLVTEIGSSEEDPPRRYLELGYAIRECRAEASTQEMRSALGAHEIAQVVQGAALNPRSATASS